MTELQGVLVSAGLVAVLMGLIWRMFVSVDAQQPEEVGGGCPTA